MPSRAPARSAGDVTTPPRARHRASIVGGCRRRRRARWQRATQSAPGAPSPRPINRPRRHFAATRAGRPASYAEERRAPKLSPTTSACPINASTARSWPPAAARARALVVAQVDVGPHIEVRRPSWPSCAAIYNGVSSRRARRSSRPYPPTANATGRPIPRPRAVRPWYVMRSAPLSSNARRVRGRCSTLGVGAP